MDPDPDPDSDPDLLCVLLWVWMDGGWMDGWMEVGGDGWRWMLRMYYVLCIMHYALCMYSTTYCN